MKVGEDVFIDKNTNITKRDLVNLGNHVSIDYGFHCTTKLNVGDYVHIGPHVSCIGGKKGSFIVKGFNNVMAGARIICGSDRFDDSGLFGALIPEELKLYAGIKTEAAFFGQGHFFQMWEPKQGLKNTEDSRRRLLKEKKSLRMMLTQQK